MKKLFTIALLSTVAMTTAIAKENSFTVKVDVDSNIFQDKHLLSADYGFGCEGKNMSPAISWKNAPKGTKSFVVTIYDKDAPTGIGWMHWIVTNIPAEITSLPEGIKADGANLPKGALQTRTDFGVPGYGGACPPQGRKHRYDVKVTALKIEKLPHVTAESMPAMVGFLTNANALAEATVTVEYGR